MNELIFVAQALLIAGSVVAALRMGSAALIAFSAVQAICANLFVLKQITFLGYDATASDAFTIGGLLALNVLQEYYGHAITRRAISISFACMIFFLVLSQLHLAYVPSIYDTTDAAYHILLMHTPRIIGASIIVYAIVQLFDAALYRILKLASKSKWYVLRNYCSIMLSQLLDTILFSFLGLYGIVENVVDIIIVSYSIKLIITLIATPFLALTRHIQKGP